MNKLAPIELYRIALLNMINMTTSDTILTNRYNLARLSELTLARKIAEDNFKVYKIKMELKKPFLQKLYELKGTV